jgi:hypothetical protein
MPLEFRTRIQPRPADFGTQKYGGGLEGVL